MNLKNIIVVVVCLLVSSMLFAQQGRVSGTLVDNDGLPLPGASIIVKGTTNGTVTDFDGNYTIECNVGETLVFTYIGMAKREVVVSPAMFGEAINPKLRYISVKKIHTDAYSEAISKLKKRTNFVQSLENSNRIYNKNETSFEYDRIRDVEIQKSEVKLTYFRPDIYYEIGYNSSVGFQFVREKNLPELQRSFSQGIPVLGGLTFQGAETGNPFSYGPALNTLEFNGANYVYDTNGQLVNQGSGNGVVANLYDNSLFKNVIVNSHQVFFDLATNSNLISFNFSNQNYKDIYNRERSFNNKFKLNYKKKAKVHKLGWDAFFIYQKDKDNQPNINGFHQNLLLNLWVTPPSFSNNQGATLANNSQRRFNTEFNNPEWLLSNNRNAIENKSFVANIQSEIEITDDIKLEGKLNYRHTNQEQRFGAVNGTAGFNEGFASDKQIKENNFNAVGSFKYNTYTGNDNEFNIKSIVNYTHHDLDFSLLEASGFTPFSYENPINTIETSQSSMRSTLRLLNQISYELDRKVTFKFINNSYYSSIQNDKWFLPSFYTKIYLGKLFDMYGTFNNLTLSSNVSLDVNDAPLYYNNLSHNSLLISPQESLNYTSNNDLFINSAIDLEEVFNYETNLSVGLYLFEGRTDIDFTHYYTKTKGSVFPVINNGVFSLANVADIKSSGFELSIDSRITLGRHFYYKPRISFSTYDTEVVKLLNSEARIPIAGFSTTSKNLIVGEPAGVIVGAAYQRDAQNNLVIGNDGFPLVNPTPQIIGDPIPNYNIGFSNTFEWKNFAFNIVIDVQKGGDIWNGTQNALNYLGTSQQSATDRGITNFIFNGVNQQGNTNTIPVDFYNPANPISENRFVRYGFEGVAEDAIVDASYVNIKSIDISYSFESKYNEDPFFRECKLGLYAKNLFTWSKFRGNSPYGALYGNSSAQELNFFNTPLLSEVGLTLQIKI